MRVVHITSIDNGGAGRACVRLHKALLESSIDSIILTGNKSLDLPSIIRVAQSKPQKLLEKLRPALSQIPLMLYKNRHKDIFSPQLPLFTPSNKALLKKLEELKPDIIHLHWIENGFINITDLAKFNAPLIWSLHDANPYTGGCHYVAASCVGVGVKCSKCPLLGSNSPYDLSYFSFKRKQKTYNKLQNLTINGLSTWIANCAKDSALLGSKRVINLPNPIDCSIFAPCDKNLARSMLGITKPARIISFGAIGALDTKRKGFLELKEALEGLSNKDNIILLIFGSSKSVEIAGLRSYSLGYLHDDISLRLLYNASDIFVMPSYVESFGQTALEALACGTPVVSFDTSGLKDIIKHKENGYLAKCYDSTSLRDGIEWVLGLDSNAYQALSINARESASKKFGSNLIAQEYIKQYQEIASRGGVESKFLYQILLYHYFNIKQKRFIGFGAIGGSSIKRKGYDELTSALSLLNTKDIELLVFGGYAKQINHIKTNLLGHLSDDSTIALALNACDIFIVPSLAENLSNAIMEALSCGIPVVAFDIGGNGDMIEHRKNGYLAKDIKDLARGIEWILGLDSNAYQALSSNARKSVVEKFSFTKVAKEYINIYKKIITS